MVYDIRIYANSTLNLPQKNKLFRAKIKMSTEHANNVF